MLQVGTTTAYNVQEAANLLKIGPATVRKYIKSGNLKAQKIGRAFYITENELSDFLARDKDEEKV